MSGQNHHGLSSQPWTILRLIRWTTDYLADKGVPKPRLDAEVMLASLLGLKRVDLYLKYDQPLDQKELAGYRNMVRRRANREPVAYIVGRKEFFGLELKVDPRVLIPRPETELLVDEALRLAGEKWSAPDGPKSVPINIIDLGTGSGAIALALVTQLPSASIWALEISESALEVARENAGRFESGLRIRLAQSDLFSAVSDQAEFFHLILANLPYVPEKFFSEMDPDVRDFEPRQALDGGEDGLVFIKRAIIQARPLLKSGGALILEIWHTSASQIEKYAHEYGYGDVRIIKDPAGHDRVAVLMKTNGGG